MVMILILILIILMIFMMIMVLLRSMFLKHTGNMRCKVFDNMLKYFAVVTRQNNYTNKLIHTLTSMMYRHVTVIIGTLQIVAFDSV